MKKIPLLLVTLLMATPAYSGGDGDPADGHDVVYEGFVVLGEEEERAAQPEREQPEAAAPAAVAAPAAPAARKAPAARPQPFNLCAFLGSFCDKVEREAQKQWRNVPPVRFPCVEQGVRELRKWSNEVQGDVAAKVGEWCDERRTDKKADADEKDAELARLQKELAAAREQVAQQAEALKGVRS